MNWSHSLFVFIASLLLAVPTAAAKAPNINDVSTQSAGVKQIQNEVIPRAPRGGRIVVHYCPKNTGYLSWLKQNLQDFRQRGWRVDRPEVFKTNSSDVRWYHAKDHSIAIQMKTFVEIAAQSGGYKRDIKPNSKTNYQGRKPRRGTIEFFLCNR